MTEQKPWPIVALFKQLMDRGQSHYVLAELVRNQNIQGFFPEFNYPLPFSVFRSLLRARVKFTIKAERS